MTNIVYFLGAGFSRNFGYPLTGEIMPKIINDLRCNDLFQLENKKTNKDLKLESDLLKFIYLLYPGLKDSKLRDSKSIPSIVEVLSFVDHCCFYNIPPHPKLDRVNLKYFQELLNRAVGELLVTYDLEPYKKKEETILTNFLKSIRDITDDKSVTIITTNYDLIIDLAFTKLAKHNNIDYGIPYREINSDKIVLPNSKSLLKYYKLHGSLNWLKCDFCGHYYINANGSIIHQAYKEGLNRNNLCICNNTIRLNTVLVAPSLVRDIRDSNLLQIWKASMEAIRISDKLVFIGYSLPAEDFAIRSILMRGINGRKKRQLIIDVVQQGDDAKPNYINIFGREITYINLGLDSYLST